MDERGAAWIDQTRVKVIEVTMDWLANRSSAEECICSILIFQWRKFLPPLRTITTTRKRLTKTLRKAWREPTNWQQSPRILRAVANCGRWAWFLESHTLRGRARAPRDCRGPAGPVVAPARLAFFVWMV